MKKLLGAAGVLWLLSTPLSAQVDKLVLKAERNIDRGNLKEAKADYQKALEKEPENRAANLGMGLMLSELLDNYGDALPYLLKANSISTKDSAYDLIFALGKCFHYNGEYEKAISYYNRLTGLQDLEGEKDFQKEVAKRKSDCEFALSKKQIPPDDAIYIVNAGKAINTEYPEYVPVLAGNSELIFTSKRKDNKKEEINYLDGKYYESMYTARITGNGFADVKRYVLPESLIDSKSYNHHQAVVSISPDSKKLFTFKDNKLYEVPLDDRKMKEPGEVQINKFNHYQNHAFLSRDGNTLYFTSDAEGGYGGTDIYRAIKLSDNTWGKPENLGQPINTAFDEDAPYVTDQGILYFASEGHEGFGNYDIYRSEYVNGKWTDPENLGQPINSPGHDIFFVADTAASAYFSSGRNGGFGDMDIYKIVYLDKIKKDCPAQPPVNIALVARDNDSGDFMNKVFVEMPTNFRVLSGTWQVGNMPVIGQPAHLEHDYGKTGTFTVKAKFIIGCDTCLMPLVSCPEFENKIERPAPVLVAVEKKPVSDLTLGSEQTGKGTDKTKPASDSQGKSSDEKGNGINASGKTTSANSGIKEIEDANSPGGDHNLRREFKGELTPDQLAEIGFNTNHILFDFNKTSLRQDAYAILDTNIRVMKNYPQLYLEVNGFADSRGPKAVNERISKQRAKAVKDYLVKNGTKPSQIKFISGKGAQNVVNDCGSDVDCEESQHQQNRRVEFRVTGDK